MKPFDQQVPGALDVAFTKIEAHIAALPENKGLALNDAAAGEVLALADQALAGGLVDAHQTARSMASFLEGMGARCIDAQDVIQLQTLLDNLRRDLYPAASRNSPAPAPALVTAIAHSAPTANNRIALYVESRAIRAMLQEVLERTGFAPRNLDAMQSLLDADETDYPAAVIADLSLCQQDSQTLTAMRVLRERFSPAPHLFCLAGGDNFAARLQAVRLGATRFLKKPVDSERLIAILKGVTAQTPTAPFRVLFIDDDQSMTTLYRAAMADIGLVAEIVNDPLLAPAKVDEFQPDVVVTDLYMPSCNGLELAAVLRQDDALADTPILFLSSETNIRQQLTALDLGADDFLTKPVNLEVLQAAVIARAKRARMLKRSRREYRRVAEHLQRIELAIDQHSIVSISDLQGNILYANQRFCDVTGYTEDELVGKNHRLLKSGVHPEAFYREMWDTISQGRTWHGEVCNRRKDGSHYWVDATVTPQLDDQGLPLRYVSVRTDITSLKELQAQLVVAKGEAEAASQAKSVFLAHMSHELKTPLNGILGFAQILQQETAPAPTADQREMLEAMERSGRHLLELINDLVDLAKIETGHLGLQMETVSMPALIRDCLALIRALATRRGISVQVIVEDESLAVHADRIRVKQVLLNLLSNAVKYNTDKGTLTVTCGRRNARVHCAVRDTGPGIPRPLQAELFLPFSRLRQSAGPVEGTGIGLSLSKSLIERMDGRIGVISDEGRGSEFWFELNLADPVSLAMQPQPKIRKTLRTARNLGWLAMAVMTMALLGSVFFWNQLIAHHEERERSERQNLEKTARQISHSVEQQLDADLRSVDVVTRHLAAIYVHDRRNFDAAVKDAMTAFPEGMVQFVTVVDASGYLAYSSSGSAERPYCGDREHFQVPRDDPEGRLFVSKPIVGRITGSPLIQLTRAIRDGNRFHGVIGLPLRPDYLANQLSQLHRTPQDGIALLRSDGSFLSISRNLEDALQKKVPPDRPYLQAAPGEDGVFRSNSAVDTIPLLFAWNRLKNWPVSIVVGLDEQTAIEPLLLNHKEDRQRALLAMGVLALATLAITLLLLSAIRDVKSRGRLETALENELAKNQAILRNASDGLCIMNRDGRVEAVSDSFCVLLGYSREEMIGMPVSRWDAKFPAAELNWFVGHVFEENRRIEFETIHRTKTDDLIPVEVSVVPFKHQNEAFLFASVRDITERHKQQEDLLDERQRLDAILKGTNAGTWEWNVQTGAVVFNERWAEIIGYTLAELAPLSIETWLALAHPDDLKRSGELLEKHFSGETDSYSCEARVRHKDGHWVWVLDRGKVTQRTGDGRPLLMSGTHMDASDLMKAKEDAEAANRAKGAFLATMSHEIRTPMNGILGMAQLLLAETVVDNERRDYARIILNSGNTLLVLLNDILDFSKIESGRIHFEQQAFDPRQILQESAALFGSSASDRGLKLDWSWTGDSEVRYLGDPTRIRQMLSNLISNAIKFTEAGSIAIVARQNRPAAGQGAEIEFSVIDTGIGMNDDQRSKLFVPFSQADDSITRRYGGTGLGLSIVRSLARQMRGDAGVESEPGKGSRFWFRIQVEAIPLAQDTRGKARPGATLLTAMSLPVFKGKVLVVEDNPTNLKVIVGMLRTLGLAVQVAENGQQGVEAVQADAAIDLVVMDVHMPVMNGYEATQRIREWEASAARRRLAIVALTADAFAEDRERCFSVGMDDFMAKPVDIEVLCSVLARFLPQEMTDVVAENQAPVRPADPAQVVPLIKELALLLGQGRFAAVSTFETLLAMIQYTDLADDFTQVERHIHAMQFAPALQEIQRVASLRDWKLELS